jgi:hypothetical protein
MGANTETKRAALFRASLTKLLPGYNWTVHKAFGAGAGLCATGIQSSGSNRCSTVEVKQRADGSWFESRLSGYGLHSPWLAAGFGGSLAQAVRSLQTSLERQAGIYQAQASTLQNARALKGEG